MAFVPGDYEEMEGVTPEQRVAVKRMEGKISTMTDVMRRVAHSIEQEVPDGTDKPGWTYGSSRIIGRIGNTCDMWSPFPKDVDLSDITYTGFYRQTARKEGNPAQGFAVSVPLEFIGVVKPGQEISLSKRIPFDTSEEQLEELARESFLALQKSVKEYIGDGE